MVTHLFDTKGYRTSFTKLHDEHQMFLPKECWSSEVTWIVWIVYMWIKLEKYPSKKSMGPLRWCGEI